MQKQVLRYPDDLPKDDPVIKKLIEHAQYGEILDFPRSNGRRPSVGGAFIRFLLTADAVECGVALHDHGLRLKGLHVSGALDLAQCDLGKVLEFDDCTFATPLILDGAKLHRLRLVACTLPGIYADGICIEDDLNLAGSILTGPVRLVGATINGSLDCERLKLLPEAEGTRAVGSLCRDEDVGLMGFEGDRMTIAGSAFFRDAEIENGCRLVSADVGGSLYMDRLWARQPCDAAVVLDRLRLAGDLWFRSADFIGSLDLPGATINGLIVGDRARIQGECVERDINSAVHASRVKLGSNLSLKEARLVGRLYLQDTEIGGNLELHNIRIERLRKHWRPEVGQKIERSTNAISAVRARVAGGLYLKGARTRLEGAVNLAASNLGFLDDDVAVWPEKIVLDRCMYGAFLGADASADERIRWLRRQAHEDYGAQFWPQPWTHCAAVLDGMGQLGKARDIRFAREAAAQEARAKWLRQDRRHNMPLGDRYSLGWLLTISFLHRIFIGYGHKPLRCLAWLAGLLGIGAAVFYYAWLEGAFKPNNAFILRAPEWVQCDPLLNQARWQEYVQALGPPTLGPPKPETQLACFLAQDEGRGFPEFSAIIYAADTLLPIVGMEMQDYWVPDARQAVGRAARMYLWFQILAGWVLSLIAVGLVSGLIRGNK